MIGQKQSVLRKWDFTVGRLPWWKRRTPPQLFVGSFALLVVFGTIGFKCLPGLYTGTPLTWEESLFTTTSAVCVTGLVVADTATRFTPLGQAYILLLIQLGGLGIIAFTSLIMIILGKRLSLRQESLASATASAATSLEPRQLVSDVVRFTIYIEAIGAALLYVIWVPRLGWRGAIWPSVFHSISAFCNAGFSTFSDSLIGHQHSPATLIVISALIVAGGLGFLTLEELAPFVQPHWHKKKFRVSINSRIVLITTTFLVFGGAAACALLEWNQTLKELSTGDRLANAFFMSVTARTAGFNSIDYAKASDSTNFVTILLMTIGGSPGSTAGGIKTTTFAILGLLAWTRMQGDGPINLFGRSLPKETIDRAVGLSVISFTTVTVGILILTVTERETQTGGFLDRMFEAVSAFNTVGVSTGITAKLSSAGKGVIIVLMFVGRVGPLSVAAILARPSRTMSRFRYAHEDVMVG